MRFPVAPLFILIALATITAIADQPYRSPYSVRYDFPESELIGDFNGPRGDWRNQSSLSLSGWYSAETQRRYGTWGPPSQHFANPPGIEPKSAEWKRQRVIATALRFQGYHYQHHHIPDWEPPADWPYSATPLGHQSKGVDCSNFTAFVYNLALGFKFTGETREQSRLMEVPGPGPGRMSTVLRIDEPADHADFAKVLQTGDLLFIRGKEGGEITHVVLWVGKIGQAKTAGPLFIDSTGGDRKDENGAAIPDGVNLRQFTPGSWYYRCASHALRIIPEK